MWLRLDRLRNMRYSRKRTGRSGVLAVGWLDFLFGPPSKDKFAKLVMAELRKLNSAGQLKYNAEQFLIERGSEGFINLANLYHEYCQAPRKERRTVLDRFIRGCIGTTGFELPQDFDDVHPDLL